MSAEEILRFWLAEAATDPEQARARQSLWFGTSAELDAEIRARFGPAIEAAAAGRLEEWRRQSRSALALVILLDQFPRNAWRGTARAFAHDARALAVGRDAVASGYLEMLSPLEGAFLILPFQHSESLEDQRESVRLTLDLIRRAAPAWRPLLEEFLRFAREHLALIARFGRFPHRNRVLGRAATAEEDAYLAAGGLTFGQSAAPS